MSIRNFEYIDPSELREILNDEKVCVVDVRDDDFNCDGHIPGATNVPSETWDNTDTIDYLIKSHSGTKKETVIFHCRLSQVRGPSCATMYLERQAEILAGTDNHVPQVKVLSGGFKRWKQLFQSEEGMIAN